MNNTKNIIMTEVKQHFISKLYDIKKLCKNNSFCNIAIEQHGLEIRLAYETTCELYAVKDKDTTNLHKVDSVHFSDITNDLIKLRVIDVAYLLRTGYKYFIVSVTTKRTI